MKKAIKMRTQDLFKLSMAKEGPYRDLLINKPHYKNLVTFSQNKKEPLYNWFYYKEGFSRELVWNLLRDLKIKPSAKILDPFCGTGNTLLASKQLGYDALGFDVLPLAVFISNTKLQENYDLKKLKEAIREITKLKFGETSLKWPDSLFLNPKKAFSRYARKDLLFFKEKILSIEDEKIRNFLFLGLLSIAGEASNTKKDGGVVRIVKKRHLAPVRYLLKNRLKRMYKDVKRVNPKATKISAKAEVADARELNLKEQFDICITSPPYLNFVDYTKLYGLELALFVSNSEEIQAIRKKSITSFIGKRTPSKKKVSSEILEKTIRRVKKAPEVVNEYFYDLQLSMENIYQALNSGGKAAIVIGNTCLPEITIDCDLILTEISEQIGFKPRGIFVANIRWCEVGGIKKDKPVRESVLILEK